MICERVEYVEQMDYCLLVFRKWFFVHLLFLFVDHFVNHCAFSRFFGAEKWFSLNEHTLRLWKYGYQMICEKELI